MSTVESMKANEGRIVNPMAYIMSTIINTICEKESDLILMLGDLRDKYTILNSAGQSIASVSKELWNWTDTYVIDVHNPQDALYALMLVLAIDAEKCSRKD